MWNKRRKIEGSEFFEESGTAGSDALSKTAGQNQSIDDPIQSTGGPSQSTSGPSQSVTLQSTSQSDYHHAGGSHSDGSNQSAAPPSTVGLSRSESGPSPATDSPTIVNTAGPSSSRSTADDYVPRSRTIMEPTKDTVDSGRYAWGGNTGNHGNKYEEDLAFALFQRASLRKSEFKLASEMKDAGKFDDVVIFFEEPKEVWLFQAKHNDSSDGSKPISFNNLFPKTRKENYDFAIIKYIQSYLDVIQKDEFKGLKMRFFILTNKSLDNSNSQLRELVDIEVCEQSEVNPIMKFAESDDCYKRFRPKKDKIEDLLKLMNTELHAIRDAIIELFKSGKVSEILINYKTPLQKILEVSAINTYTNHGGEIFFRPSTTVQSIRYANYQSSNAINDNATKGDCRQQKSGAFSVNVQKGNESGGANSESVWKEIASDRNSAAAAGANPSQAAE
ncbi:uncharacterized protein LOC135712648 [Ochlerotatus camptorhynchus]|uniref:uncharacterized protein LOC135712648 n=1 Tax=Ochlerotatus camptorhynchus TaxID=644619 RepID=UPI0031DB86BB